ncbi:hypothetical protein D3C75_322000 [compost metagenome]
MILAEGDGQPRQRAVDLRHGAGQHQQIAVAAHHGQARNAGDAERHVAVFRLSQRRAVGVQQANGGLQLVRDVGGTNVEIRIAHAKAGNRRSACPHRDHAPRPVHLWRIVRRVDIDNKLIPGLLFIAVRKAEGKAVLGDCPVGAVVQVIDIALGDILLGKGGASAQHVKVDAIGGARQTAKAWRLGDRKLHLLDAAVRIVGLQHRAGDLAVAAFTHRQGVVGRGAANHIWRFAAHHRIGGGWRGGDLRAVVDIGDHQPYGGGAERLRPPAVDGGNRERGVADLGAVADKA